MKVLFMGTPDFAVASLKSLYENGFDIVGVITQPDKARGRGHIVSPSPVKQYALEKNLKVFQPLSIKDNALLPLLNELNPDIVVVTAYGKILPKYILSFPKYGCVNIHASLLPKYRGASPIQSAIISGETVTGITSMYMVEQLDAGDMLLTCQCDILDTDNAGSLHDRLMNMSGALLIDTLNGLETGTIIPVAQNNSLVTFAPIFNKQNCRIDFTKSARDVFNFIRGLSPFPSALTSLNEKSFKISKALVSDIKTSGVCGEIEIVQNRVFVSCSDFKVEFLELTAEGGKKMCAFDYFNGHNFEKGYKFI